MVGKSADKKEDIRSFMKARMLLCCLLKDVFSEIKVVYDDTTLSYDTVRRWKKKFNSDLQSVKNTPKSGIPKRATKNENVANVKEILEKDARYTMRDLARMVGISLSIVHFFL